MPAVELYADIKDKDEDIDTPPEAGIGSSSISAAGVEYDIVGENGEVVMRTNRRIIDDPNSQVMTMSEIEAMKAQNTGSGKELVARILESHSALDQKTAFALAKYTLRKTKKYLKRFTVLPMDVAMLAKWMLTDKEPLKIMEIREEMLALIGSWSNVHCTPSNSLQVQSEQFVNPGAGRWLVIDECAGLLVAYLAEKMGILHPNQEEQPSGVDGLSVDEVNEPETRSTFAGSPTDDTEQSPRKQPQPRSNKLPPLSPINTITLLHANAQPNLSLLKYFHFEPFTSSRSHPLSNHLRTLSWLQLLAPEDDASYAEPEIASEETLQTWKSGKRANYFRKRRRWERIKLVVDETRAGGFDGLIVASVMKPTTILQHIVPLLRGAAQVVVYSPTIESLVELADHYSSARRRAFITDPPDPADMPNEDFPVNPTLLLAPSLYTARARSWQVLPGRTHPLMTGRGASEGYIFTATRVIPAEGKVEARGKQKRRKVDSATATKAAPSEQIDTTVAENDQIVKTAEAGDM